MAGEASNGAPSAQNVGALAQTPSPTVHGGGQAAANPGAPGAASANSPNNPVQAAAAEAARKFKIKIDGQETEVDENELLRGYSHQKVANKKFQEGLKLRKQSEEFLTAMKDPSRLVDTLQKMGWEPKAIREVAEKYLAGILEDEMLDPKDKELKSTKSRLAEYEKKENDRLEAEKNSHQEALKAKYAKQYEAEFVDALKGSGLPPTKQNVGSMASYIARAAKIKMPMTALEAAKLVQQDLDLRDRHRFASADPESIIKVIGEEGLKKLREYDVAKLRNPAQNLQTPTEQGEVQRKRDPGAKRMTPAEWRAFNRK